MAGAKIISRNPARSKKVRISFSPKCAEKAAPAQGFALISFTVGKEVRFPCGFLKHLILQRDSQFAQRQAPSNYSISRTGFWSEAPAAVSTISPPASRNINFKLHATRNPATARETGVIP